MNSMRLDRFTKEMANQYLTNDQLTEIRKTATAIVEIDRNDPTGTTILKLLNQLILVTADKSMIDIRALQDENAYLKQQLKAMGQGYFKLAMEIDQLQIKLESLGVTV